jgi:hypothetical protein
MRKFVHNCNLKANPMPLSTRQRDSVKSLLCRASELIADAQNVAAAAGEPGLVASLKQLRLNIQDEIADLDNAGRP